MTPIKMGRIGSHRFFSWVVYWVIAGILTFMTACDTQEAASGPGTDSAPVVTPGVSAAIPTIYPTFTPKPTATPFIPPTMGPTEAPPTPINFNQTVVELTYSIPGLGLERSIRVNVSNQVELIDGATRQRAERSDQPGVVVQLQQVLRELDLEPVPPECPMCVVLDYELPIDGIRGSGWLQDTRLLASLENYTAALLGPHFPENTVVGLRRSATPYQVAHTVALTEDGQIWAWSAIDPEIPLAQPPNEQVPNLLQLAAALDDASLKSSYLSVCPQGPGVELLYLAGFPDDTTIRMTCPELTLPTELLPLYLAMDGLVDSTLELAASDEPEKVVPLDALMNFERDDGWRLTVFNDGTAVVIDDMDIAYTSTMTVTNVISLTTTLARRGIVQPGVTSLLEEEWGNRLFLRGPEGVYEAVWNEVEGGEFGDVVAWLGGQMELIVEFYRDFLQEPTLTPTPAGTTTAIPEGTPTPGNEATLTPAAQG